MVPILLFLLHYLPGFGRNTLDLNIIELSCVLILINHPTKTEFIVLEAIKSKAFKQGCQEPTESIKGKRGKEMRLGWNLNSTPRLDNRSREKARVLKAKSRIERSCELKCWQSNATSIGELHYIYINL